MHFGSRNRPSNIARDRERICGKSPFLPKSGSQTTEIIFSDVSGPIPFVWYPTSLILCKIEIYEISKWFSASGRGTYLAIGRFWRRRLFLVVYRSLKNIGGAKRRLPMQRGSHNRPSNIARGSDKICGKSPITQKLKVVSHWNHFFCCQWINTFCLIPHKPNILSIWAFRF